MYISTLMPFVGLAPGPRVSMEITNEMLKSMKVGLPYQDYVSSLFSSSSLQFICLTMDNMTLLPPNKW